MQPMSPKWLEDAAEACARVAAWTAGLALADYAGNALVRSAVERQFEIIGEALLRLERDDPDTAGRLSQYRKIIGFRNRIAHGYDVIDHGQVWAIVQGPLPLLRREVDALLGEARGEFLGEGR